MQSTVIARGKILLEIEPLADKKRVIRLKQVQP